MAARRRRAAVVTVIAPGPASAGADRFCVGASLGGRRRRAGRLLVPAAAPDRLEVHVLQRPAHDEIRQCGAPVGQECGDRGGDGGSRYFWPAPRPGNDRVRSRRRWCPARPRLGQRRRIDAGRARRTSARCHRGPAAGGRPGAGRARAACPRRRAVPPTGWRCGRPASPPHPARGWSGRCRRPCSFRPATTARMAMRPSGSTPAVGSSRKATSGRPIRARREREALLLAAGEVTPGGPGHGAEADQVEQLVGRDRVGVVAGEEIEDAARSEHRVHAAPLEHHPDAAGERGVIGDRGRARARARRRRRGAGSPRGSPPSKSCRRRWAQNDEHLAGLGRRGRGRRPRAACRQGRSAR